MTGERLASLLCPPYDVIDDALRARLLAADPGNAVSVVLPRADDGRDAYRDAAQRLRDWTQTGAYVLDEARALYVYEMQDGTGSTRGLLGAVELRDPSDGVILPHEDTMAGPVADRLALMSATEANVEPIYLVYDGGGSASDAVRDVDGSDPIAEATTPDAITHRLWAITDPAVQAAVAQDLQPRHALIADGHHRYATYRKLQQLLDAQHGPGAWDRGLTLLVDSSSYGPQVHAIHRVLVGIPLDRALEHAAGWADVVTVADPRDALQHAARLPGFAAVLTDGKRSVLLTDSAGRLADAARRPGEPDALTDLDVTVLHRALVQQVWQLSDSVEAVGYAHSLEQALVLAQQSRGTAVLLRATPVSAVAAVASVGARMPRKSTLFTPKPASGLVMRRFADES